MGNVDREERLVAELRARMAEADIPKHAMLAAYDGLSAVLLAILQELRATRERETTLGGGGVA